MRTDMIIPVLLVVFLAVYFFVINPAQEEKKKAAKEAAQIAMEFGDRRPTLFQMDGKDGYGRETVVYVLFPCQDCSEILSCTNYHIITQIFGNEKGGGIPDREYKKAHKYIDEVKSNMPYHIPFVFSNIKWDTFLKYQQRRYEKD